MSLAPFYTFANSEPFYEGGVVQTPDGTLYTLVNGPAPTLLRFAPDGTLTSFPIAGHSQDAISGPLLLAGDGNFYGVILGGSPNDAQGSIFRLTPGGVRTRLHVFTGDDGTYPQRGLVQGPDGALDGATTFVPKASGVPSGDAGTVFRCTLDGTLTTLHRFAGGANAAVPQGTLTVGRDGNLYGLASSVLFSVTPGGAYTFIHDFSTYGYSDRPNPGFVQDSAGFFYGTTDIVGSESADYPFALGTVFRFTPDGQVTTLCRFNGQIGAYPIGPLSVGPDDNFYGVLSDGGDGNEINNESGGALFRRIRAVFSVSSIVSRVALNYGFNGYALWRCFPFDDKAAECFPTLMGRVPLGFDVRSMEQRPTAYATTTGHPTIFHNVIDGLFTGGDYLAVAFC